MSHPYTVVLAGVSKTGKTAIAVQYTQARFIDTHFATGMLCVRDIEVRVCEADGDVHCSAVSSVVSCFDVRWIV